MRWTWGGSCPLKDRLPHWSCIQALTTARTLTGHISESMSELITPVLLYPWKHLFRWHEPFILTEVTKPEDLSSILRTYMEERLNWFPQIILWLPHMLSGILMFSIQINKYGKSTSTFFLSSALSFESTQISVARSESANYAKVVVLAWSQLDRIFPVHWMRLNWTQWEMHTSWPFSLQSP